MDSLPVLISIVGPTASGKSALALRLCQHFGGEIVTADSRQVYKLMDIGTDKPTAEDRLCVPHYMLDLVYPDEPYTLAMYHDGALSTIADISARGKVPVLAGGTPLYVNAVTEGWVMPRVEPDIELRQSLESKAAEQGVHVLYERLRHQDPEAAAKILPSNTRRIIRALEVIMLTGRPISEQQGKLLPPFNQLRIGLLCERKELYRRVDHRVELQFIRGLIEEVRGLQDMGYGFNLPAMSGIGYRQVGAYLLGRSTLEEAKQRIKWDTHAFVRHQANWFRRAEHTRWLDVTESDPLDEAIKLVDGFLYGGLRG